MTHFILFFKLAKKYFFLPVLLCSPLYFSYADFPWILTPKTHLQKEETYTHFKIETFVNKFFNENIYRFNLGGGIKSQYSYLSLDLDYLYRFSENNHYLKPYDVAIHIPFSENFTISLGRKRQSWSWADLFWKRGLWEPMFNEDYLRPTRAGLTGVFGNFRYKSWEFILFGSYIFIPGFGPTFKAEEGKVISKNPWVTSLPQGKVLSAYPYYHIRDPQFKDFVLPSAGFKTDFDFISFSYIFKPVNQVLVKTKIPIQLDEEPVCSDDSCNLKVYLEPFIIHHHLANINLKLKSHDQFAESSQKSLFYTLDTSITLDLPENISFNTSPPTIHFQPENELHFSALGAVHVKDSLEETLLYLAYTHQLNLNNPDINKSLYESFANIDWQRYFKNEIYYFSRMATVGLEHYLMFTPTEGMDLKTRLNYHLIQKYFLFSFYISIILNRSMTFFLTGDLLFRGFPFQLSQTTEDIGIYSNKSRVLGGVSYVF